ncbi:MAG: hypothetical protein GYB52_08105 [Rhodospirillales bacterium]|nr:hypothetical protein [Rhodospirillales bacterium]MBR9816582.1 hypothetical protein [Rhodospirillales bacterium]
MNEFSKTSREFEEAMEAFYNMMKLADEDREISLQAATELRNAVDRFVVTTKTSLATTALQQAMDPIARNIGETVKSDISSMYKEAEKAQKCAEVVTANMTQKARKLLWPILGVQALFIVLILALITGGYFYFRPLFGLEAKRAEYAWFAKEVEFLNLVKNSKLDKCETSSGERYLCAYVHVPENKNNPIQRYAVLRR